MKAKKIKQEVDPSTEEKIKNAARIMFHKKGFAATRTRDIAEEAGINLALLNYYFRSKEKLFDIIMLESMQSFLQSVAMLLNNQDSTWDEKIELFVSNYIDFLMKEPDLPLFVLSELRSNPSSLISKMNMKQLLMKSNFIKQFKEEIKKGKMAPVHPLHFLMNTVAMIIFPFIGRPIVSNIGDLKDHEFIELMQQRKKLIPQWIKMMYKPK
ncbi:MAG TPA: TetR/AcrR family transcriptional regulator [Bacteroidia bacterium]|jgi:AcrR family transcriptional regulator|nr:TetR/AcrR family transcriptional regulator [Bacteroidia bacterium]